MKTTTVRLDDDMLHLIEEIAKDDGCRTADVVRAAVRDFVGARAKHDQKTAERAAAIAERRRQDNEAELRDTFGSAVPAGGAPAARARATGR